MRYFIRLSYFGKNFHGWQIQPNAITVQETLNQSLSTLLGEEVYTVGAGRTDTGVHAREMWMHFDLSDTIPDNFLHRANSMVGPDIALSKIVRVPDEAHARFDAVERSYEYRISLRKDPFEQDLAWYVYHNLDLELMEKAAETLYEFTDFTSFSRSNTQTKTNNCRITKVGWEKSGNNLLFSITADRFLRNMVRAIVGTLVEIGTGKRKPEDMFDIIAAKDRRLAGESAPAHGLFLTSVKYPKKMMDGER